MKIRDLLEVKFGSVLIFLAMAVAVFGLLPLVAYLLKVMETLLFWLFFLFMPDTVKESSCLGQIGFGLIFSVMGSWAAVIINKYRR